MKPPLLLPEPELDPPEVEPPELEPPDPDPPLLDPLADPPDVDPLDVDPLVLVPLPEPPDDELPELDAPLLLVPELLLEVLLEPALPLSSDDPQRTESKARPANDATQNSERLSIGRVRAGCMPARVHRSGGLEACVAIVIAEGRCARSDRGAACTDRTTMCAHPRMPDGETCSSKRERYGRCARGCTFWL
jgi:hypothetical protein